MSGVEQSLVEYYARRAAEYEEVYRKPERQKDLAKLAEIVSGAFTGMEVLEIACGTGYWTQFIARSAKSILATDTSAEVLEIARRKEYGACGVEFLEADAYSLANVKGRRAAGFHGFWWSHVPIERTGEFLRVFHERLVAGAAVMMIDNRYVKGSSTPISRRDERGNIYQVRRLRDGSKHEVLKNFPGAEGLRTALATHAEGFEVEELEYYWIARYKARDFDRKA
jgi:SAM-dependent methyltransferase